MTLSMIVGLSSKSLKFALFSLYISLRLDLLFLCLLYHIIHQIVGLKKLYCLAVPVSKIRDMLQKFVVYMGHMQRYSSLTQSQRKATVEFTTTATIIKMIYTIFFLLFGTALSVVL